MRHLVPLLVLSAGLAPAADPYALSVVARGLDHPVGITTGSGRTLYVSEIPTPGVGGGRNGVIAIDTRSGSVTDLHRGEPEPVNLALSQQGQLYWTCRTAGVILSLDVRRPGATVAPFLTGLLMPTGIDVRGDTVFWTEVPTPGVGGSAGGANEVKARIPWGTISFDRGDPQPADIAVGPAYTRYWTCRSAGVIAIQDAAGERALVTGLHQPNGIAIDWWGKRLYWTEVPTPGVKGSDGGQNEVWELNLATNERILIHAGDPYPSDVTVAHDGTVYWTCTSAGVVVQAKPSRRW